MLSAFGQAAGIARGLSHAGEALGAVAAGIRSWHLGRPASAGVGLALLAALSWGGGDFSGGMGVKAAGGSTGGALRLVIAAHAMSFVVLLGILGLEHAPWPGGAPMIWALLGGVAGGLSLTAFYMALARGTMGASAALSGLLAAAIPALISVGLEGAPTAPRLIGFGCAAAAIWLIAAGPGSEAGDSPSRSVLGLAVGGGIGFGIYFVALRFANTLGVIAPMAVARAGSLAICLALLPFLGRRERETASMRAGWLPARGWLWALGVAVLDTGGNLLFIAATRRGRLDVAAVLASLYPVSTILLAGWLLKEHPSRRQLVGMAVAAGAVVLITV